MLLSPYETLILGLVWGSALIEKPTYTLALSHKEGGDKYVVQLNSIYQTFFL